MHERKAWFSLLLREKLLQNDESLGYFFVRIVKSWFSSYMEQSFSFMWKKALKIQRMRMLANYADPHHRILSDPL